MSNEQLLPEANCSLLIAHRWSEATMAVTVIYAVELAELERWVGARDPRLLREAQEALREGDEEEWEPEELRVLDRLLARMVNEGKLYDGLEPQERYYFTQLLIDLFDEFVDSEAVTDEVPHSTLVTALDALRSREPAVEPLCRYLSQGRTLGGDDVLWRRDEDIDDVLPFFGYLRRAELQNLVPALERALQPGARGAGGGRTTQAIRSLPSAIRLALETERDLLSFTG
jgi:hypothetical protein